MTKAVDPTRFEKLGETFNCNCDLAKAHEAERFRIGDQNLASDENLSADMKFTLLEKFDESRAPGYSELIYEVNGFCRVNQRLGKELADIQITTSFGHVLPLDKFKDLLMSDPKSPFHGGSLAPVGSSEEFLRWDLTRQKRVLKKLKLTSFQMWCFYNAAYPKEPFRDIGTSSANLRRQLGLGHLEPTTRLVRCAVSFEAASPPCVPTVLDAEFNVWFRSGGRTQPLDGAADGLHEVVHQGVTVEALVEPLRMEEMV